MIVKNICLRQFRNYDNIQISLDPSLTIFTGENASGKTNLLEGIAYLSLTRSFRTNDDRQLIQEGKPFAKISLEMEEDGSSKKLDAILYSKGKTLCINEIPVSKTSEFLDVCNIVLFSPDDLFIYSDSPKEKRKLMDQEIVKFSKKYLFALTSYQTLLKQRNMLFKQKSFDENLCEIYTKQMIAHEKVIVACRRAFVERINTYMPNYYKLLSGQQEVAKLQYQCMSDVPMEEFEEKMEKAYKEVYEKDRMLQFTTIGIHREDLIFLLDEENVIHKASQGQKRMVMLAYKMALLKVIEETSGRKAVLLLDDVLSELDEVRQKNLFLLCQQLGQCILTSTSIPNTIPKESYLELKIQDGRILRAGGNK